MTTYPQLPPGFVFGTSTASYQIEGAVAEGGRGPSIWDTFTAQPGRVVDGSTGTVACDHYHRYAEDVALMARLGVQGYRFSFSWSRILPAGVGEPNPEGLDFYDRLLDALLAAGIAPLATLFHWDLPQALQDEGGFTTRETAYRFADYATLLGERYGDRVASWIPVNEPNVFTLLGHAVGVHAPGLTLGFGALGVAHHLLLGHGLAVQALRAAGATRVGTAVNHQPIWPASDSEDDAMAAGVFHAIYNDVFARPVLTGAYPEALAGMLPDEVADDLATIHQPIDFYGVNYYNPMSVGAPAEPGAEGGGSEGSPGGNAGVGTAEAAATLGEGLPFAFHDIEGCPRTDFGWPIVPDGLREVLVWLKTEFGDALPPVHITEGGCSYGMGPDEHGVVDDQPRIDYLDAHLRAVGQAIEQGVDVRGYYTWSLLDNFEWAEGFTQRFGLVHVDFETLARTPKRSFDWYGAMIAAQQGA